ncbi:Ketohexokinase [Madurella mycetomatis]|uniref:Ketohexokinase n=1 Tax=Madurella mycetomatis TaxID=100816 RepID=A0A175VZI0_9PEZI|nr:Ketohexokinase [Madurella mycetomatis]
MEAKDHDFVSRRHSNSTLPSLSNSNTTLAASYQAFEQEICTASDSVLPAVDDDLTPRKFAIKRTESAKQQLAECHEGWMLVAQMLYHSGVIPNNEGLLIDINEFGDAICGRYAAATFLWGVLTDMPEADWFGPKVKFDTTLRRLKTLKGLEGSVLCWGKVVLDMIDLVDGRPEENSEEFCGEVMGVLERWRRGIPSRP